MGKEPEVIWNKTSLDIDFMGPYVGHIPRSLVNQQQQHPNPPTNIVNLALPQNPYINTVCNIAVRAVFEATRLAAGIDRYYNTVASRTFMGNEKKLKLRLNTLFEN